MNPALTAFDWLPADLVRAVGWTLVHFLWQGALIAGVLNVALRASRTAQRRHDLALLALAAMAAAPVVTFLWVRANAPVLVVAPEWFSEGGPLWSWHAPVVALWIAGVVVLTIRAAGGLWLVEQLRRQALALPHEWIERCARLHERMPTRLPVAFMQSLRVDGPSLVGWFKPVVLIPSGALLRLSAAELEALILHEIAHVRRFDAFANLVQTLVETVLFYHPAVWWVSGRLRIEREHCCDDLAVAALGDRVTFVRALQSIQSYKLPPEPALAAGGGSVRDRAARLLGVHELSTRPALPRLAAVMVLATAALTAAYSARVEAAPAPEAPPMAASRPGRDTGEPLATSLSRLSILSRDTQVVRAPASSSRFSGAAPLDQFAAADLTIRRLETLDRMIELDRRMLRTNTTVLETIRTQEERTSGRSANSAPIMMPQMDKGLRLRQNEIVEARLNARLAVRRATVEADTVRQAYFAGRASSADVERAEERRALLDGVVNQVSAEYNRHYAFVQADIARVSEAASQELDRSAARLRDGMRESLMRAETRARQRPDDPAAQTALQRAREMMEEFESSEQKRRRNQDLSAADRALMETLRSSTDALTQDSDTLTAVREAVKRGERPQADLDEAQAEYTRRSLLRQEERARLAEAQDRHFDQRAKLRLDDLRKSLATAEERARRRPGDSAAEAAVRSARENIETFEISERQRIRRQALSAGERRALAALVVASEAARQEGRAFSAVRDAVERGERPRADLDAATARLKAAQIAQYDAGDALASANQALSEHTAEVSKVNYERQLRSRNEAQRQLEARRDQLTREIASLEQQSDAARASGDLEQAGVLDRVTEGKRRALDQQPATIAAPAPPIPWRVSLPPPRPAELPVLPPRTPTPGKTTVASRPPSATR